jgi:hypothetical protein
MYGKHPYYLSGKDEQNGRDVPLPRAIRRGGDKAREQVIRSK